MDNIKRGEIFYISRGGASYSGSEQHSDRPAVVVSNNKNNENSNVVEIVYMTTQPKTDLQTHVTVRSTGRPSTVLCEQVYSVSTERIGTYIGECTDKEMENIDIALMISLQLDGSMKTSKKYNETSPVCGIYDGSNESKVVRFRNRQPQGKSRIAHSKNYGAERHRAVEQ